MIEQKNWRLRCATVIIGWLLFFIGTAFIYDCRERQHPSPRTMETFERDPPTRSGDMPFNPGAM